MKKSRLTAWIELTAAASVLIGLLFVAQELRQNNRHARAESVRDLFQMWSDIYRFQYEEDIHQLIRNSVKQADDLTDDEILRIGSYLSLVINAQMTQAVMQKEGALVVGNVVDDAPGIARSYFSSEVSRAWLKANEDWIAFFSPEFYQALIDEIDSSPVADEVPELERIKLNL